MGDRSGFEPQLGGLYPRLSGYEPVLAVRQAGTADLGLIRRLLDARDPVERGDTLEPVFRFGRGPLYAAELAQIIPARARHQLGGYRTGFTTGQRVNAIEALHLIGGAESILPLLEVLDDSAYQVRDAARLALPAICARLDSTERRTRLVYQALVEALAVLPVGGRRVVAELLAAGPPSLTFGPLVRWGLAAPEPHVRRESARILGLIGDKRATKSLIAALADPVAPVRGLSAWALGRMPTSAAVPPLIESLSDPDANVRASAVEALGCQAARLFADGSPVDAIVAALGRALNEGDPVVISEAFEALVTLNSPGSREVLAEFQKKAAGGATGGGR